MTLYRVTACPYNDYRDDEDEISTIGALYLEPVAERVCELLHETDLFALETELN